MADGLEKGILNRMSAAAKKPDDTEAAPASAEVSPDAPQEEVNEAAPDNSDDIKDLDESGRINYAWHAYRDYMRLNPTAEKEDAIKAVVDTRPENQKLRTEKEVDGLRILVYGDDIDSANEDARKHAEAEGNLDAETVPKESAGKIERTRVESWMGEQEPKFERQKVPDTISSSWHHPDKPEAHVVRGNGDIAIVPVGGVYKFYNHETRVEHWRKWMGTDGGGWVEPDEKERIEVTYPVLDVPDDYEAPTRKARAPRAAAKPEGDGGGGGRGEGEYTDNQIKAFKKINRRQLAELHSFYRKAGIESRDVEDRLKKNIDDINNAATKEQFTAVNYAQTQIYKTIADLKPGESAEAEQEEEVPPTTTTEGADEIKEEDTVAAKPDAGKDKRTGKKKVAKRVRRTTAEILGELEDKIGTKLDTTTPAPKIDRTPTVEGTDVESALAREYGETAAERRVRIALESERAMAREYGYKAGEEHLARADQVAREMSAIEAARRAYENRGIIGRFRDWLNPNRTPPPMTLEEYRLQTRTDLTPEAKNLLQAKEAMMLRRFGYRARAAEAGVESRWSWFEKKNFKGAARSIAIGAAVLAALSAAGIATIPAGLVGVVGGSLVGTWAKNVTERMGYKGWKSQVAGFVLGSAAGFGLGSLTNAAINADWSSMFNKVFGGGAESIPVGGGGITAFPADVATPVLSGGESVASNLIEGQGMIQGLPDIGEWGRGAFEDAFRNFVEQRGLKGDLIGQALANTPWERLPNGTAVNFGEFFGNQRNVDGLIRFITSNYPTLAGEMTDAGTNVASYVRGVAQGYTGGR